MAWYKQNPNDINLSEFDDSEDSSSTSSSSRRSKKSGRSRSRSPARGNGGSGGGSGSGSGTSAAGGNSVRSRTSGRSGRSRTPNSCPRTPDIRSPSPSDRDDDDGDSDNNGSRKRHGGRTKRGRPRNSEPSVSPRRSRSMSPGENVANGSGSASGSGGRRSRGRATAASGSDDDGNSDDDDSGPAASPSSGSTGTDRSARRRRIIRQLNAEGLNIGEKHTPGRVRNPSKYTDKSMHTNLDRSPDVGNARRRMAEGLPSQLNALCTNRLGKVRLCKSLLTPMNFRRVYLRIDNRLPRNLLMALTLDESDRRLRTLNADDVIKYYYHAASYLAKRSSNDEILNSDLAVGWLMNAIHILNKVNLCTGYLTVSEAINEKYHQNLGLDVGGLVRMTVEYTDRDCTQIDTINKLCSLAKIVKPTDIRIWGYDAGRLRENASVPKYNDKVFLGEARRNEVRVYPLAQKKSWICAQQPQ